VKKHVLLLSVFLLAFIVAKAQPGYINTIAGGSGGNNTLAINAQLLNPWDIVSDNAGNIYFSDLGNSLVQKINLATGIITIIAGNGISGYSGDGQKATDAELNIPRSVAVDTAGNVYIADQYNNRIRRVDAKTGLISTVAGGGTGGLGDGGKAISAVLSYPCGIAVDKAGNLYIADIENFRVRKVTAATGIITTIAGTGQYGYSGDGGPATDADILPAIITLDTLGNIYFSDQYSGTIRKINKLGVINSVVGNGSYGYCGDNIPATDACFETPSGVLVDDSGNIYVTDLGNSIVRKVWAARGDTITTIAGDEFLGYSGDGGQATDAELYYPCGVCLDAQRNIYITDFENNRIRKVNTLGVISTIAGGEGVGDGGSALNAALTYPMNISVDKLSNIYIADYFDNRVRKISTSTGIISTVAGSGFPRYGSDNGYADTSSLFYPTSAVADDSGNVYILSSGDARIRKVNTATGTISTIAGNGSQGYTSDNIPATDAEFYFQPSTYVLIGIYIYYYFFNYGLTLDKAGNIYIADGNNRIRRIDALTDTITTIAGNGLSGGAGDDGLATDAELDNPTNVALDDSGNLYVTDFGNNRVRKVEASTGVISTVAGGGVDIGEGEQATDALLYPTAVAVDSFGNIFIADVSNNQIREVNAATGIITTVAGDGVFGYGGDGGKATQAEIAFPEGVTIDASDNIYIGDTYNNRVRKVNALQAATGINTIASILGSINLYPNPTNNTVNINFGTGITTGNGTIRISDITGRELITLNKYITSGSNLSIDLSSLPAGMYFVAFNIGQYSEVTKVVKD
jgi:trimeric autotransporter adhesin